jgi:Kef-type K+ transport system membrane component KefB
MPYLAYEEPGITVILALASFLFLLNALRYVLDRFLYCGLIGEILLGVIWGEPVGRTSWLSLGTQEAVQAFGYLGLIGLIFEGGLATDATALRNSMILSISVATVGLCAPIALSFLLLLFPFSTDSGTAYPKPLAAFSAGAAMCSTSLGTTFSILSSAGMQKTTTGVVLVGAAMMDDVVGLVMVNIVTTLGSGSTAAWPIARPIVTSFGMLLVTLVLVPFALKPAWVAVISSIDSHMVDTAPAGNEKAKIRVLLSKLIFRTPHMGLILSTFVLMAYVTIADFIDASVLFAAFLAGGVVRHFGEESGEAVVEKIYENYFRPALNFVLVPFFFVSDKYWAPVLMVANKNIHQASIGFSIPITDMFRGDIVWKGIVYALLMMIGKVVVAGVIYGDYFISIWRNNIDKSKKPPHTVSLVVGCAMVARGEIGFLIASLAQSSGTLSLTGGGAGSSDEDIFLVIIWAVTLCTIAGPVTVGFLVRRMRAKENAAERTIET